MQKGRSGLSASVEDASSVRDTPSFQPKNAPGSTEALRPRSLQCPRHCWQRGRPAVGWTEVWACFCGV